MGTALTLAELVRTLHVYNQQLNTLQLQLLMQDGSDRHEEVKRYLCFSLTCSINTLPITSTKLSSELFLFMA